MLFSNIIPRLAQLEGEKLEITYFERRPDRRQEGGHRVVHGALPKLEAWNDGWPLDSPDQYIGHLSSITSDEVNATLARCAAGTEVALLGDEPTIRSATAGRGGSLPSP